MVYITGDTHGDLKLFKNPKLKKLTDYGAELDRQLLSSTSDDEEDDE